jgi:hypothetical protein
MAEALQYTLEIKGTDAELAKLEQINSNVNKLKQNIKEQSTVDKQAAEQSKLTLKQQQKAYRDLQKEIQQRNAVEQKSVNTLEQLRAQLTIYNKELQKIPLGTKQWQEQANKINEVKTRIQGADESVGKFQGNVGNYKGGIISAFQQMGINVSGLTQGIETASGAIRATGESAKGASKGFKILKVAIASTGIGLLVIAVGALVAAFKGSEEGQNKWNKVLSVTGAIVGNFIDLLADLGDKIIWVFENPKQALKDFGNLIKDNIITRFEGMLNFIPAIGTAIKQVFSGDFSGAAKTATDALGRVVLGVESVTYSVKNATDAVKEFAAEQAREAKLAADVADKRAKADKIERDLLVEQSKVEQEIAALRLKARQEDEFSAQERRKALTDAQDLEDNLMQKEIEALQLRADAQALENSFARSNKDNLDEEAKLIAAVNNQTTARLNQQRQTQRELNRINREIERDNLAADKELKAIQKQELEQQISNEIGLLKEKSNAAKNTLKEQYANQLISEQEYNDRKKELQIEANQELLELYQQYSLETQAVEQEIRDAELDRQIELNKREQEAINKKKSQELDYYNSIQQAQEDLKASEQNLADLRIELNNTIISSLSDLFGTETAVGKALFLFEKALAISSVLKSGAKAKAEALANFLAIPAILPPGIPNPALAFAAAKYSTDLAAIKTQNAIGIAQIAAQTLPAIVPKFASGVIGLSGAGTETSDSISARLSKGESVMTARATKVFAPVLASMEEAVGNKPNFQIGTGRFANGIIGATGLAPRTDFSSQIDQITDKIIQGVGSIPVVVAEGDITGTQNRVRKIKVTGDL